MNETIRRARLEDAHAIAEVHVASWRTTYKGIMSEEILANLSVDRRTLMWEHELNDTQTMTYVAEEEQDEQGEQGKQKRIVGFVSGGPNRTDSDHPRETDVYHCELYAIYLLQEVQGHGLGRLLTRVLIEDLRQRGYRSMILWVAADNPARKFYEALGGKYISTQQLELGDMILDEVSYGWDDINSATF